MGRGKHFAEWSNCSKFNLDFYGLHELFNYGFRNLFFRTRELNPAIAWLVNSNPPAFIALKLTVTIAVGLVFILTEKTLTLSSDENSPSIKTAIRILKIAYFTS